MKPAAPLARAWLNAGLESLLVGEARAAELRRAEAPAAAPEKARASAPREERGPARAPRAPQAPAPRDARPSRPVAPESAGRPAATPAVPSPESAVPADPRALPPAAWPPAWQALRKRRPLPPRPMVVWSYAGLGDDLMGQADPVRQQIIARMITALQHPGGTHVFWPYALPDAPDPQNDDSAPSLFWSGVALLKPRALLVFGREARDALGLPAHLEPYCQERIDARQVIVLPPPLALADNDETFRRAQVFLARLLRPYVRSAGTA